VEPCRDLRSFRDPQRAGDDTLQNWPSFVVEEMNLVNNNQSHLEIQKFHKKRGSRKKMFFFSYKSREAPFVALPSHNVPLFRCADDDLHVRVSKKNKFGNS
jgi:hypothetical protein